MVDTLYKVVVSLDRNVVTTTIAVLAVLVVLLGMQFRLGFKTFANRRRRADNLHPLIWYTVAIEVISLLLYANFTLCCLVMGDGYNSDWDVLTTIVSVAFIIYFAVAVVFTTCYLIAILFNNFRR